MKNLQKHFKIYQVSYPGFDLDSSQDGESWKKEAEYDHFEIARFSPEGELIKKRDLLWQAIGKLACYILTASEDLSDEETITINGVEYALGGFRLHFDALVSEELQKNGVST